MTVYNKEAYLRYSSKSSRLMILEESRASPGQDVFIHEVINGKFSNSESERVSARKT